MELLSSFALVSYFVLLICYLATKPQVWNKTVSVSVWARRPRH